VERQPVDQPVEAGHAHGVQSVEEDECGMIDHAGHLVRLTLAELHQQGSVVDVDPLGSGQMQHLAQNHLYDAVVNCQLGLGGGIGQEVVGADPPLQMEGFEDVLDLDLH